MRNHSRPTQKARLYRHRDVRKKQIASPVPVTKKTVTWVTVTLSEPWSIPPLLPASSLTPRLGKIPSRIPDPSPSPPRGPHPQHTREMTARNEPSGEGQPSHMSSIGLALNSHSLLGLRMNKGGLSDTVMGLLSHSSLAQVTSKTVPSTKAVWKICRQQGDRREGGPFLLVLIIPPSPGRGRQQKGADASGVEAWHLIPVLCRGENSCSPSLPSQEAGREPETTTQSKSGGTGPHIAGTSAVIKTLAREFKTAGHFNSYQL